jgi:hypothetical protein
LDDSAPVLPFTNERNYSITTGLTEIFFCDILFLISVAIRYCGDAKKNFLKAFQATLLPDRQQLIYFALHSALETGRNAV